MKKSVKYISLVFALTLCLTGCGQNGEESTPLQMSENMIHLYQVDENQIVEAENDYQLKTPDSLSSCVEDVMTALTDMQPTDIVSYSYMMGNDNSLQLELTLKEGVQEKEEIMLMMAAVTKTIFQLDDISSIQLIVKDAMGEEKEKELFLPASFYYYSCEDKSLAQEDVSIYVPDENGTSLNVSVVKEQSAPNISDQELIVCELVKMGVLPSNTKVNQVSVHDSICYLDLSGEFLYGVGNSSPELVVYSLVNSVIRQTGVETVQILIDGKIENRYRNAVDIKNPLSFNSNVIQQP